MANSKPAQNKTKRLQPKPDYVQPILSTPAGMYAPDWDSLKAKAARRDRESRPNRVNPGDGTTRSK